MEASSTVVIKVKHGDVLRRFNANVVDQKLQMNMVGLREKILSLFSFAPDTDMMLTYIDEDGDVVSLVDEDDLKDVMKQGLNPLRVTVKVNDDKNDHKNHSNASSTPSRSPRVQRLPNLTAGVSEILRKVPEPLRDTLLKLSDELAAKASSSSPSIAELVDNLSKVSSSLLGQHLSESGVMPNMQNDVPESSSATHVKASEPLKVDTAAKSEKLKPDANMKTKEVKLQNVTGQKEGPSFDFDAVLAALESQNINISKPESVGVSHMAHGKEKIKKTVECSNGKSHAGKVAAAEPKLGSNSKSGDSPSNGEHVIDSTTSGLREVSENAPVPTWSPSNGGLNFGKLPDTGFVYECPFSGTLEDIVVAPPRRASDSVPFRRSSSRNDGSGTIFHRGVRCDGCGIHPIVGPRFKSKVKVDYDLCCVCFEKMGNENDYTRMDRPVVHRHHLPHFRAREHIAMFPRHKGSKGKLGAAKLDSRFIQDVNIFDGTIMAPLTPFTKIWRMKNNGTISWPPKTQLIWIGGDKLTDTLSVEVQIPAAGLHVDQELDVAVDFISPELPGRYISYWRTASPSGPKFGQRVWVQIQVDASISETPQDSVRNLNLNLPPASSSLTGPEIINIDPAPVVEDRVPKSGNPKAVAESRLPNTENELKFPINDSLLVGNGAGSSSAFPYFYPSLDLSDLVPNLPSVFSVPPPPPLPVSIQMQPAPPVSIQTPPPPPPIISLQPPPVSLPPPSQPPVHLASPATAVPMTQPPPPRVPEPAVERPAKDITENGLLRELEEMGFKQVDLNKEVLRMNDYDLEKAVDDLCGVAEWDPILEELQEMGFNDTEMNKRLLKKNKGSIKRVVMELIAGEEV